MTGLRFQFELRKDANKLHHRVSKYVQWCVDDTHSEISGITWNNIHVVVSACHDVDVAARECGWQD